MERVRAQFPALNRAVDGRPAVYLDGPAGTQVPRSVIDAMATVMTEGVSNLGGPFVTSTLAHDITSDARAAAADFVNASPDEVAFGLNMTSLTFAVSRAIGATWGPGDEVVVTSLDHDANVWPWVLAANDAGATVRFAHIDEAGVLPVDAVAGVVGPRTRLVAITLASNLIGSTVDVASVAKLARDVGALMYVDAVHAAPHLSLDVEAFDADFLVCSPYKFFGPHAGMLVGKRTHLESLTAFKIRPAPDQPPDKWESGTQSFETLAGVTAGIDYLASLGSGPTRRASLVEALDRIGDHEQQLGRRFLDGVGAIDGVSVHGAPGMVGRVPTFGLTVHGVAPSAVIEQMATIGVFAWSGNQYAVEAVRRLGLEDGGVVRIGFVHYNTIAEVDLAVAALHRIAGGRGLGDLNPAH